MAKDSKKAKAADAANGKKYNKSEKHREAEAKGMKKKSK